MALEGDCTGGSQSMPESGRRVRARAAGFACRGQGLGAAAQQFVERGGQAFGGEVHHLLVEAQAEGGLAVVVEGEKTHEGFLVMRWLERRKS
jgi:hypothetical protein